MEVCVTEDEQQSETDLIRKITNGERDEFRHLVIRYQDRIYALIKRQVGDESVSRELTQDTFVRAYQSLPKFRHESKFSTWLIRIAMNVANSYFSSKRFKEKCRTVSLSPEDAGKIAQNIEEETYDDATVNKLRLIVGTLPEHHRCVLVLCGFERKSYGEASLILGIPIGTVRSRLNKARQLVRVKFFGGL